MKLQFGYLLLMIMSSVNVQGQNYHLDYPDTAFLSWNIQDKLEYRDKDNKVVEKIEKDGDEYTRSYYQDNQLRGKSVLSVTNGQLVKWEQYNSYRSIISGNEIIGAELLNTPTEVVIYKYKDFRISHIERKTISSSNELLTNKTSIINYSNSGIVEGIKTVCKIEGHIQMNFEKGSDQITDDVKEIESKVREYYSRFQYLGNKQIEKIYEGTQLVGTIEVENKGKEIIKRERNGKDEIISEKIVRFNEQGQVISEIYQKKKQLDSLDMDSLMSSVDYIYSEGKLQLITSEYGTGIKMKTRVEYK